MTGQSENRLNPEKNSVKSVYNHMTRMDSSFAYKSTWKAKISEKVKIFMWLIMQNSILTKENMIKRNWGGDPGCYFCNEPEMVDHLLFSC
jgi:hypothetical protein